METTIRDSIKDKVSQGIYQSILKHQNCGAKWLIADDGVRLYTPDGMLIIWIKSSTMTRGN